MQAKFRDVGLMVVDTSQPGWTVLHADCNNPCIDGRQAEGQSLWDKLRIPDVVRSVVIFCCLVLSVAFLPFQALLSLFVSCLFHIRNQGCFRNLDMVSFMGLLPYG